MARARDARRRLIALFLRFPCRFPEAGLSPSSRSTPRSRVLSQDNRYPGQAALRLRAAGIMHAIKVSAADLHRRLRVDDSGVAYARHLSRLDAIASRCAIYASCNAGILLLSLPADLAMPVGVPAKLRARHVANPHSVSDLQQVSFSPEDGSSNRTKIATSRDYLNCLPPLSLSLLLQNLYMIVHEIRERGSSRIISE